MPNGRFKNKQLNLFSDNDDTGPFSISVTSTGNVQMDLHDTENGEATKTLTMVCKELIVKRSATKKQNIIESLNAIEAVGQVPNDFTVDNVSYLNQKRPSSFFTGINHAFLWENNRAITVENSINESKNIANSISKDTLLDTASYKNINQAFLDESNRAIEAEKDIFAMRASSSANNIPRKVLSDGNYKNINQAFVDENSRAINSENSITEFRSKNNGLQTDSNEPNLPLNVVSDGNYLNINQAFVNENRRAITIENSIVSSRNTVDANFNINANSASDGNYNNINQAFVDENSRAVNVENEIIQECTITTLDPLTHTDYKEISNDINSIQYATNYKMNTSMDYVNINKAVLEEHRRAVTVENELNARITALLAGTTDEGLDTLQEIVSMFQNNDLTMGKNLHVFSSKYNALVNDFNTLSQSHKDLLDRVNNTLISTQTAAPSYSDVTQESISFNTQTGLVNFTQIIDDDGPWDKTDTSSTNGVWFVKSQTEGNILSLPQGASIQSGTTLIIRKVDSGLIDPKPFQIQYTVNGATTNINMQNDGDEVVVLGLPGQWYILKQP